MSPHR